MRCALFVLLILFAQPVSAGVSINEVAWMGSASSANHEWIELYNDDASNVSVDGWTLKDGMNFSITLSGVISGSSFAVLERTSDASSPATAFLTYVGALVNTGATLTLADAQGAIVDQVAGGADWKNIGGDNTTKETAQYHTSGWVTDAPTPGAQNRSGRVEVVPEEEEEDEEETDNAAPATLVTTGGTTSGSSRSSNSSGSVRLENPVIKLKVIPDVQSIAYEHQTIPFNVRTTGIDDGLEKLVRYVWNFGDSYVGEGKNPTHAYAYPGTYVVTVTAEYKKNIQTTRHELTILPVDFSLTRTKSGDIQIHNDAKYDVDISGYTVRGSKSVTFPSHTIMASLGTVTLGGARLQAHYNEMIGLYDQKGRLVTSLVPKIGVAEVAAPTTVADEALVSSVLQKTTPQASAVSPSFGFSLVGKAEASESLVIDAAKDELVTATAPEEPTKSNRLPYYVFIGVLLLAVLSLILPRPKVA